MSDPPASDINQELWLETVSSVQREFVDSVVSKWNSQADKFNQWLELGWDERDALLTAVGSNNWPAAGFVDG